MSALAKLLRSQRFEVSGSDLADSTRLHQLAELGCRIFVGHEVENVVDSELVAFSSAVAEDNVELEAARERGLEVWNRARLLAALLDSRQTLVISGTHGKTTTTALAAHVLTHAGLDPLALIGGKAGNFEDNLRLGEGPWTVVEADESDGTFLELHPDIAIVTNVDCDHVEFYRDFEGLKEAFGQFCRQSRLVIMNGDDPPSQAVMRAMYYEKLQGASTPEVRIYSIADPRADVSAMDIRAEGEGMVFDVYRSRASQGIVRLPMRGFHNVSNCLAVLTAGFEIGLDLETMAEAVAGFRGVGRRFEAVGDHGGALVVDDYAHHPAEIAATLRAAKSSNPRRVICVFQPHRYSRIRALNGAYCTAFGDADYLFVTRIYSAGEKALNGVTGERLAERIRAAAPNAEVRYRPMLSEVLDDLRELVEPGDLVITMGAGDVWKIARSLVSGEPLA